MVALRVSRDGTEAGEGFAGAGGDGGEGGGDEWVGGHAVPELVGPGGGLLPDLAVGGEREGGREGGVGRGVAYGRGPLHRQHVVGGREAEGQGVVEPEGEVAEVHIAVADQAAEGVAQADGAQRGVVDEVARAEVRCGGGLAAGVGAGKGVVQSAQ